MVAGRTVATRAASTSPLKLLLPRRPGPAAWIYSSTYGGGLVAGDQVELRIRLQPQACAVLSTQSATKVYKSPSGTPSRQTLDATVGDGSLLVLAPDPVSCFRSARYQQRQRIAVTGESAAVVVDWMTSGRRACGERWSMDQYDSRLDVYRDGAHILADNWLLDPRDGPLTSPFRIGRFHCVALIVMVGRPLQQRCGELLDAAANEPIAPDKPGLDRRQPAAKRSHPANPRRDARMRWPKVTQHFILLDAILGRAAVGAKMVSIITSRRRINRLALR